MVTPKLGEDEPQFDDHIFQATNIENCQWKTVEPTILK